MPIIIDDYNVHENQVYAAMHNIEMSTFQAVPKSELEQPLLDLLGKDYFNKEELLGYLLQRVQSGQLIPLQIGNNFSFKFPNSSLSRAIENAKQQRQSLEALWALSKPESLLMQAIDALGGANELVEDYKIGIKYNELAEPDNRLANQVPELLDKLLVRLVANGRIKRKEEEEEAYNTQQLEA